jgi:hypothetical protein
MFPLPETNGSLVDLQLGGETLLRQPGKGARLGFKRPLRRPRQFQNKPGGPFRTLLNRPMTLGECFGESA